MTHSADNDALTDDERERIATWLRHRGVYSFGLLCDIADCVDGILTARVIPPEKCKVDGGRPCIACPDGCTGEARVTPPEET